MPIEKGFLQAKTNVRRSGPHFRIHRTELQSTNKKTIQFNFLFAPFFTFTSNAHNVLIGRVCVRIFFLFLLVDSPFILYSLYNKYFYRKTILEWNVSKFMWLSAESWFYFMSITFCTKSMFTNKKFRFIFCVTESRIFLFYICSITGKRLPNALFYMNIYCLWVRLIFFMFVSDVCCFFFSMFTSNCLFWGYVRICGRDHSFILLLCILLGCRVLHSTLNSFPLSHARLYFLFVLCECLVSWVPIGIIIAFISRTKMCPRVAASETFYV